MDNKRKMDAQVHCHGLIFTGKSAEEVYQEVFAHNAPNPEWRGTLTLEEVKEVFEWTRPPRKVEKHARETMLKDLNSPEEVRQALSQTRINT